MRATAPKCRLIRETQDIYERAPRTRWGSETGARRDRKGAARGRGTRTQGGAPRDPQPPRPTPSAVAEKNAPRRGIPLSRSPDHQGGARPSGAGRARRGGGPPEPTRAGRGPRPQDAPQMRAPPNGRELGASKTYKDTPARHIKKRSGRGSADPQGATPRGRKHPAPQSRNEGRRGARGAAAPQFICPQRGAQGGKGGSSPPIPPQRAKQTMSDLN